MAVARPSSNTCAAIDAGGTASIKPFDGVLHLIADPACLLDIDGYVAGSNAAWSELLAACSSHPAACFFAALLHPEDRQEFLHQLAGVHAGTSHKNRLHRFQTSSGQVHWLQWSATAVPGSHLACIVLRDVTREQQRIADLTELAEFNRRLLESSQDCIKVLDASGRLLSMTPIGRTLLEIPDEVNVIGKSWCDFWQGEEAALARNAVADGLAGKSTRFSGYCPTMSGVPKWWDIAVSPIDDGGEIRRLLVVSHDITQQKANEEIIRRSKDRFQILTEMLPQIVWMADAAGHVSYVNPRWHALTQFDEARTAGMGWLDAIEPSHRERIRTAWLDACRDLVDYEAEAPLLHAADGTYRWHLLKGLPVRNLNGQTVHWIGIGLDIDERRRAQEAIATSAQRFRFLAESLPQNIFTATANGCLDYCNRHWLEYAGIPLTALSGFDWLGVVHHDDMSQTKRCWEQSLSAKEPFEREHRLRRSDGLYRWHLSRAHPMRDDAGAVLMWVGSHTDIHDIKESEAALRLSEIRYRSLVTSSAGIVWSCTPALSIDAPVSSWQGYTGQAFEAYRDDGWRRAVHPDDLDELEECWAVSRQHLRLLECRCRLKRHDGSWRVNLVRGVPVLDSQGTILEWVCTAVDIHDRSEAQRQLEIAVASERAARAEAERIGRIKDEFLTTLSHELRTPLNAILGWSQILLCKADDAEAVARGIAVIDRNVRLQTRLIEDLLDMSGIISGKIRLDRKLTHVEDVLHAAVESVIPSAAAKDIRIDSNFVRSAQPVLADVGRLQQVFWNLLANAVKFTRQGGHIDIAMTEEGQRISVRIRDDGEGIAPDFLPHIFERFTQGDASIKRRHGGLGVGLSIVRTLVTMHGGSVRAESAGAGHGAAFEVALPACSLLESGQAMQSLDGPAEGAMLKGRRILVIDDEADARELLQRLLHEHGVVTQQAASAADGYAEISRFEPDLILCDIGMPVEDGYQFLSTLRRQGVAIPAVALTAFAREEDRTRSLQAGFQKHLTKPVEASILFRTLADMVGR